MREGNLTNQPTVILLAEDDPGDQELTRRTLEEGSVKTDLRIVNDGEEAIDYLLRRGRYADPIDSPRPDLVLLDMNMPKLNGKQVLETTRQFNDLKSIPIVMLTTTCQKEEITNCYNLGCNSFVTKPATLDGYRNAFETIEAYWFKLAALPSKTE